MRAGRVRRPVGSANALPPVRPVIAGRPWARRLRREGQGGPCTHPRLCRDGPAPHGPMGPRGYGSMAASPHRTVRWEGHVSQEPADPTASSAPPDGTSPTIPSEAVDVQPEPLPVDGDAAGGDAPADGRGAGRRTRRCGQDLRRDECRHPGCRDGGGTGASRPDRGGRAGPGTRAWPSQRCRRPDARAGGRGRGAGSRGRAGRARAATSRPVARHRDRPAAGAAGRRARFRGRVPRARPRRRARAGWRGGDHTRRLSDAGADRLELQPPPAPAGRPRPPRRPGPRRRRGHRARSTSSSAATSCPPSPPASASRSRPSWTPTASRTPTTSNRASGSSSRCPEVRAPGSGSAARSA